MSKCTPPPSLVQAVRLFFETTISHSKTRKEYQRLLSNCGMDIYIWLKYLKPQEKKQILNALPLPCVREYRAINKSASSHLDISYEHTIELANDYVNRLSKVNGVKIFIGKDAYLLYVLFKKMFGATAHAHYIPFSRPFLFHESNGADYFKLTECIHRAHLKSESVGSFRTLFSDSITSDEQFPHWSQKTIVMLRKMGVLDDLNNLKKFTVIDSGIQGTLASLLTVILQKQGYTGNASLFYVFSWLQRNYKQHCFQDNPFIFYQFEIHSAKHFKSSHK